jgi:phospholipid/cholesterol/gamma-HCH transport system permease protein
MTATTAQTAAATGDQDAVTFALSGSITAYTVGPIWEEALATLTRNAERRVVIDASDLKTIDNTGIALLFDLKRHARPAGAEVEIRGLAPNLAALIPDYDPKGFAEAIRKPPPLGIIAQIGRETFRQIDYLKHFLGFLGDCARALLQALRHRGLIRWREVLSVATEAGANAVPIVLLIGFLMGVIIAFEIGLVAQQFGAVIFVVDGVGVAMLRELGALMTAIVFAGRTGAPVGGRLGAPKG